MGGREKANSLSNKACYSAPTFLCREPWLLACNVLPRAGWKMLSIFHGKRGEKLQFLIFSWNISEFFNRFLGLQFPAGFKVEGGRGRRRGKWKLTVSLNKSENHGKKWKCLPWKYLIKTTNTTFQPVLCAHRKMPTPTKSARLWPNSSLIEMIQLPLTSVEAELV